MYAFIYLSIIESIRKEDVKSIYVLCTKGELNKYRVPELLNEMKEKDFLVHHYPFPDGGAPVMSDLVKMLDQLKKDSSNSRKSLIQ